MPRVLLVDDSSTMRRIVRQMLETFDSTSVIEAADGNQALALFHHHTFDLVLTDWNMPGMNGLELSRQVRQTNGSIPIMMITTEAERVRVVEAIQAGVTDYLVKPFSQDSLRAKISQFCSSPV